MPRPRLTVVHRHDCALCEEMLAELEALGRSVALPPIDVVDVDSDPLLRSRHGLDVPGLLPEGWRAGRPHARARGGGAPARLPARVRRPPSAPKPPYNPPAAWLEARQHAAVPPGFMRHIRHLSIIAHVDHGKSTPADRFIQLCGGLADREMHEQVLDSMELERERGITIKAQSVTLYYTARDGERYQLNMIDTPGHVDFSYEVSRSLAASDGALLVVDASQGVEAQSVANCYTAIEQGVEVLPVINKIDLPSADPDRVSKEIEEIIGIDATDAVRVSAKTGEGVPDLLEALIKRIPPPKGDPDGPLQALIIDSRFDNYVGVVSLVRVMNGALQSGAKIRVMSTGRSHQVDKLGRFAPKPVTRESLDTGEVGFVIAGIKEIDGAPVGDTITLEGNPA